MEGLLDEVDSLVMPDLSTAEPDWCENCQKLRVEVKKLKEEQLQSFGKLKQKIISTDLLIKKYKSKCEDYDVLCKKNEEATKRADKLQRQSEILEAQLKAALLDVEPLRQAKTALETELVQKTADVQRLSDQLVSVEGTQRQFEHANKAFSTDIDQLNAEKKELLAKIRQLETGKVSKGAAKEFRSEISSLKKENSVLQKSEKKLEKRLTALGAKNEALMEKLKHNKLSPIRGRGRTMSGHFASPTKSPIRSPRGVKYNPTKSSHSGMGRARTISEKSSPSTAANKAEISFSELLNVVAPDDDTGSSSDDAASMCSMRWLFSPIVDRISPLPQSPACFNNRKATESPVSDISDLDGDNLSDIADELEQQLIGGGDQSALEEHHQIETQNQQLAIPPQQEMSRCQELNSQSKKSDTQICESVSKDQVADPQNRDPISQNEEGRSQNSEPLSQNQEAVSQNSNQVSQNQQGESQISEPLSQIQEASSQSSKPVSQDLEGGSPNSDLASCDQESVTEDERPVSPVQGLTEQSARKVDQSPEPETQGFEAVLGDQEEVLTSISDEQLAFTPVQEEDNQDIRTSINKTEDRTDHEGHILFDIEAMEYPEQDKHDHDTLKDSIELTGIGGRTIEVTERSKDNVSEPKPPKESLKGVGEDSDMNCDRTICSDLDKDLDVKIATEKSTHNQDAESENVLYSIPNHAAKIFQQYSEKKSAGTMTVSVKPSCSYHVQDQNTSSDCLKDVNLTVTKASVPHKDCTDLNVERDTKAKVCVEASESERLFQESFEFETDNSVVIDDNPGSNSQYQDPSGANNRLIPPALQEAECSSERTSRGSPDSLDSEENSVLQGSRSATASVVSFGCSSPLSPLPMSPFEFIIPISPLPPSPVRGIARLSPVPSEQADTEDEDGDNVIDGNEDVDFNIPAKPVTPRSKNLNSNELNFSPLPALVSPIKTPKAHRNSSNKIVHPSTCKALLKPQASLAHEVKPVIDSEQKVSASLIRSENLDKLVSTVGSVLGKSAFTAKSRVQSGTALKQSRNINEVKASTSASQGDGLSHGDGLSQCKADGGNKMSEIQEKDKKTGEQCAIISEQGDIRAPEELPSGKDSIMTFNRRVRLAHQPNASAVKSQRIQIIEAPALPVPKVGRKRKNVETTGSDTKEKKPVKASTFKKRKSVGEKIGKDEARKMQGFLKSTESAENFITKETGGSENPSAVCYKLIDACLECLSRVKTDSLHSVYEGCEVGIHTHAQTNWPFLNDVEKQTVTLLKYLIGQKHLRVSASMVKVRLWERLFNREVTSSIVGKMSLCRVFIALSALEGDLEQARVLFYNIASCGYLNICQFVVPVASVWPAVLQRDTSEPARTMADHDKSAPDDQKDGLTLVLEKVVTKTLISQETETSRKTIQILQKLIQWSGDPGDSEEILKTLLNRLLALTQADLVEHGSIFELTKAIELLCLSEDWQWFRSIFVLKHGLQCMVNRYKSTSINKSVPAVFVCSLIKVTGAVLRSFKDLKMSDIKKTIQTWIMPLLSKKPVDVVVRDCCLEMLLELSTLHYAVLPLLQMWYENYDCTLSPQTEERLNTLQREYSKKFGLVCGSFKKRAC